MSANDDYCLVKHIFNISYTNKQVYSQWTGFPEKPWTLKAMQTQVPNEISFKVWNTVEV